MYSVQSLWHVGVWNTSSVDNSMEYDKDIRAVQDFYLFSETNLKDFSRTPIDFSRTPHFILNPFIPKILNSILLTVYLHFLYRKF